MKVDVPMDGGRQVLAGPFVQDDAVRVFDVIEGGCEVDRIPADDGVGEQSKALSLKLLVVGTTAL